MLFIKKVMVPKKAESCTEEDDAKEVKKADEAEENDEDMSMSPNKIFQDGVGLVEAFKG